MRLTNVGTATPLISAIKVRYYFVDDSPDRTAVAAVTSARWQIANQPTSMNIAQSGCSVITTFATAPRNSYVDVGCAQASPFNSQDTITIAMTIDPATQLPTNDYSYIATGGVLTPNDHMLLIISGVVVAGTPPP